MCVRNIYEMVKIICVWFETFLVRNSNIIIVYQKKRIYFSTPGIKHTFRHCDEVVVKSSLAAILSFSLFCWT